MYVTLYTIIRITDNLPTQTSKSSLLKRDITDNQFIINCKNIHVNHPTLPVYSYEGSIKGWEPNKLTSCEGDFADHLEESFP